VIGMFFILYTIIENEKRFKRVSPQLMNSQECAEFMADIRLKEPFAFIDKIGVIEHMKNREEV